MTTRKEVAEYAGVSTATITRVMNGSGYVAEDTRRKVEEAIKKLKYQPNAIAQSLRTKSTKQILFYTPDLLNPFYVEIYLGMEKYAREQGYNIVVSCNFDKNMMKQRQFDGVVLSTSPTTESEKQQVEVLKLGLPVVACSFTGVSLRIPSVYVDMREGAHAAINYLVNCGHREIAYVTDSLSTHEERLEGYKDVLKFKGISFNPRLVIKSRGNCSSYEYGYEAGIHIIQEGLRVTAVFTSNDATAIGLIAALTKNGVKVPDDISVIGFDNIVQSQFTSPTLTTVHLPKYEQGVETIKLLINQISGKEIHTKTLNTKLIIRNSVSERK